MIKLDTRKHNPGSTGHVVYRDQQRARYAYACIGDVDASNGNEYKICINDLGSNILRLGLCAALAALTRRQGGIVILAHLAGAGVPGLERTEPDAFFCRVRELDVDAYMLATREILQVTTWLKRAAQATFGDS